MASNWKYRTIGEVCKTTSGGTPSRSNTAFYENGTIPWVKTGELINKYLMKTEEHITQEALQRSSAKMIPANAVIMAMYGATIGKTSIIKKDMSTNQACCAMITDEIKSHHEFLYYILSFLKDDIIALGAGGAQPNISQQIIKNIEIPVPPISEQRKIATILSAIDHAVSKTDAIIEQTEKLKTGLMQQLFTCGIGHTKFKQTEIGEVPEEWQVVQMFDVINEKPQNGLYKSKEYYDSGYPMVHMSDMFKGDVLDSSVSKKVDVNEKEANKYCLMKGDILFARRSLVAEGAGKCIYVPKLDSIVTFESSIIRISPNKEKVYPMFLNYYFKSKVGRENMKKIIRTVAASGITGQDLMSLSIPLPSLPEQLKIAEVISLTNDKLQIDTKKLETLKKVKSGLMQVLLTGKVRVIVDDKEVVTT